MIQFDEIFFQTWLDDHIFFLPETNSKFTPANRTKPNRKPDRIPFTIQAFRCEVMLGSGRVDDPTGPTTDPTGPTTDPTGQVESYSDHAVPVESPENTVGGGKVASIHVETFFFVCSFVYPPGN